MKAVLILGSWLLALGISQAQSSITLEQCYAAATSQYPLAKQKDVLRQSSELSEATIRTNRWLPQLSLNGQASWQSEVVHLPIDIPNFHIPQLSQDQYKITLDASYMLFDGNRASIDQNLQRASTAVEQGRVDVELNRLKEQVNAYFLNALLTDESIRLHQTQLADLQNRLDKLSAGVKFGTAAQINLDALRAESLRVEGKLDELTRTRQGLRAQLALLTGLPVEDSTQLQIENVSPSLEDLSLNRPELSLYHAQRDLAEAQLRLTSNKISPRISLFAQPGYGRPGLNFLDNNFRGYFIGGIRLSWNLSQAYTLHNEQQIQQLNRQQVDIQQATFEKNLTIQLRGQQTDIERLQALLTKDAEIVALRTKVRQSATAQFDNGAIAARDYTTELNAETQALLNQRLHELQLVLARIQYRTLTGN